MSNGISDGLADVLPEEGDNSGVPGRVEAATMNHVADVIGNWADRKGFRQDWADAAWLVKLADEIEREEIGFDLEEERGEDAFATLRQIAKDHERLANVCKIALMMSELSEAIEGMRDGGNYGEELADLVIRAFENAAKNKVPIGDEIVAKVAVNEGRPFRHGRQF